MAMVDLNVLRTIADVEFSDIVVFTTIVDDKLRVTLMGFDYSNSSIRDVKNTQCGRRRNDCSITCSDILLTK